MKTKKGWVVATNNVGFGIQRVLTVLFGASSNPKDLFADLFIPVSYISNVSYRV